VKILMGFLGGGASGLFVHTISPHLSVLNFCICAGSLWVLNFSFKEVIK